MKHIFYLNIVQFILLLSLIFKPLLSCYASDGGNPETIQVYKPYIEKTLLMNFDFFPDAQYIGLSGTSLSQPMLASGISFFSSKKYDVSFQTACLWNSDTSYIKVAYQYDFNAGYTFYFSPKFSVRPSYSQSVFSRNSNLLLKAFSGIAETDVLYISNYYLAGSTLNYLLGKKNMFYFTLQNAAIINFEKIFGKKSLLSFQLEVDIHFNDKNYYNSFLYESWNAEEFLSWIDEEYYEYHETIVNVISTSGLDAAKDQLKNLIDTDANLLFDPSYTFTSFQVSFPVMLTFSRFTINLIPLITIPCYQSDFYDQYTSFMLNAGFSILFNP